MKAWLHEDLGICATVDPIDANAASSNSDAIDMSKFSEVMFIIALGVLNDSATCTVTIKEAATSGGSYTAISGKSQAIVGTDDAKQFIISVKSEELGAGKRYVRSEMTNSAHSQLMAIVALGRPLYRPGTDDDLSTVQTPVA